MSDLHHGQEMTVVGCKLEVVKTLCVIAQAQRDPAALLTASLVVMALLLFVSQRPKLCEARAFLIADIISICSCMRMVTLGLLHNLTNPV